MGSGQEQVGASPIGLLQNHGNYCCPLVSSHSPRFSAIFFPSWLSVLSQEASCC